MASETRQSIEQSYIATYKKEEQERFKQFLSVLLENSGSLSPLSYYLKLLNKTNEADMEYMQDELKLKRDLYLTYLLLLQAPDKYAKEIEKCGRLIDLLDKRKEGSQTAASLEFGQSCPGMPASYCGLNAGLWLVTQIVTAFNSKDNPIVEWMTAINDKRLYWVWGGGLLRTVLSMIPEDFYYQQNAQGVVNAPARFTGYMSWTLYFARFALNSFLVLKETFDPKEEKNKKDSAWERFKTQLDLKKFSLLNDSIWGLANMVCFFWFKGSEGDALTIVLLAFDVMVAIWDFWEQQAKYLEEMNGYLGKREGFLENKKKLVEQLANIAISADEKGEKVAEIAKIELSIKNIEKKIKKAKQDWQHKEIGLIGNIIYAYSLMISFAVMTLPFLPIPAATLIIIGLIGAVLCFALTVIYNGIKGGLEVRKEYLSAKEAKSDLIDKIEEFEKLSDRDDPNKLLLFLQIKQLQAKSDYHEQMITYQIMKLLHAMIIQSFAPILIFVSSVFLPLGVGIGVLSASFVVAVSSNFLVDKLFKGEEVEFSEFDNAEYERACANPKILYKSKGSKIGLFSTESGPELGIEPQSGSELDKEPLLDARKSN